MSVDTADHLRDTSPWKHEPNPVILAILGKLVEELGELNAALGRCIIQGVNESHPVTEKPNVEWLLEEIADVQNLINFVIAYSQHDKASFKARLDHKCRHINQWLDHLRPACKHDTGYPVASAAGMVWSCCGKMLD